jgi:histidinol-phosphate aminotransferase
MTASPTFPSTWVPGTPYRGPAQRKPDELKLDGNEGSALPAELLRQLSAVDGPMLRDYPDAGPLEAEIARELGVAPRRVVVTAGADDALDRVCRAFLRPGRSLVLPVPTFEMLYRFAQAAGGEVRTVSWGGEFPTSEVLDALDSTVAVIAMVSPNNPTGSVATADDLVRVAKDASGSIVLLDHVYVDYADENLMALATSLENVVTVRSFSKAWGLAGCRVGYCVASEPIAHILRNVGNPFPVAGPSLSVVRGRLGGDRTAIAEHVERVRAGRTSLAGILAGLGMDAVPSQGNFVFADFGSQATLTQDGLASMGIRVRSFPQRPEIADSIRISVPPTDEEMDRLVSGLQTVLAPEALLFDMDGVLADVEGSYRACVLETARSFGIEIARADLEEAVLQGGANNDWELTQRLLRTRGVDLEIESVTARFQEIYLGSPESPGLREREQLLIGRDVLQRLAARRPLGIVTGRPAAEAEWFLQRSGITDLFGAVVCMEDGPLKPDPAPVRLALDRLGVTRAWMVGDTPDDLRAARAAGALPVGIVAPGDDPDKTIAAFRQCGVATVLNSLTDLEGLLP